MAALLLLVARPLAGFAAPELTEQSDPADGQSLVASPAQLSLVFSEDLPQAPGVVIQDSKNQIVTTVGAVARGDDAMTWYVPITTPLPADFYKVSWTSESTAGFFQFTVGTTALGGTVSTEAATATSAAASTVAPTDTATTSETPAAATAEDASGAAGALNVMARWLSYLAIAAIAGGLLVIALAWPEGVEYVLTGRYLRLVWLVALGAAVLNLICTRAVMAGESFGSSISPGSWGDLSDNAAGLAVLGRFVLLLASGWVVFGPERAVDEATQIPAFLAPTAAVLTFGFTRSGQGIDAILVLSGAVHVLAFAAWFGGLALLWRVVLAGSGEHDLVEAVRGFSRLARPAMLGIVVSGLVLLAKLSGGLGNLFGTGYGRLMLLKAIFVTGMIYVGFVNRQTVAHRLQRANTMPARTAFRLRRALGTELIAGVVVLGLTGWMVGSHPPGLSISASENFAEPTVIVGPLKNSAGLDMEVGMGPGTSGLNDVTITVNKPATGLVTLSVQFDPLDQYVESIVIDSPASLTGKGTLVVPGVPFNAPGRWKVTVTATGTEGSLGSLESEFILPAGAGITDPAATTTTVATAATTTAAVSAG